MAKELFADYVKEKKLREHEENKELAQTLKTFYFEARKKGLVQCIIKQLLDSVFVISRLNNQGLGKGYQPKAKNPYLDLNYSGYHKNLIQ